MTESPDYLPFVLGGAALLVLLVFLVVVAVVGFVFWRRRGKGSP
jgi:cbb3-type cytochrome oxidase subunit 3